MSKAEILFLSQEEEVQCGLLDMKMVMEEVEKAFFKMGKGMVKNPPKVKLGLPENHNWTCFFNSMPSWLGSEEEGDEGIVGFKWAAESKNNVKEDKGLPLGVDVVILSDPHTVMPKAIMDGTIITAMRTSAVAGVAAKYLAPKGAKSACLVGAGVIGRTMVMAMMEALPELEVIYMADLKVEKCQGLAEEFKDQIKIVPSASVEESVKDADVIVTATTAGKPIVFKDWVKKEKVTFIQMSGYEMDVEIGLASKKYVDNYKQMMTFDDKLLYDLVVNHNVAPESVWELSDVATGAKAGREDDDKWVICMTMGMGMQDIIVANKLYENALAKGLGTKLTYWENPLWV